VAADATKSDCAKLWKAALGFALALASDCTAAGIRVLGALLYVAPRCLEGSRFRPSVRASCWALQFVCYRRSVVLRRLWVALAPA